MATVTGRGHAAAAAAVLVALCLGARVAAAQTFVSGRVVTEEADLPLAGALVTARLAGRTTSTDRFGQFALWLSVVPDTLDVRFLGRLPASVAVAQPGQGALRITLGRPAIPLSAIMVVAPAPASDVDLRSLGQWELPLEAARAVPPVVETDLLRALVLVPAVSFSTPLSARPIVRGYDAGDTGFRIDGFEVINPYHVAQAFAAFAAEGAEQVTVSTAPFGVEQGGALGSVVDIRGRTGAAGPVQGGASLSLATGTAWIGGALGKWHGFGAARAAHVPLVLGESETSFDVGDLYVSTSLDGPSGQLGRLSAFVSRDRIVDNESGGGMRWSNALLGGRVRVLGSGPLTAEVSAWATEFTEDISDLFIRGTALNARNRFGRVGAALDVALRRPRFVLKLGLAPSRRQVANRISPVDPRQGFDSVDVAVRRGELAAYVSASSRLGAADVELGLRTDVSGGRELWQPRLRARLPVSEVVAVSVSAGRTARLHHFVTDPRPEPEVVFFDFWLDAGRDGIPVASADHLSVQLDAVGHAVQVRASAFASRARGLVELRPLQDTGRTPAPQFRSGQGRTLGLEVQATTRQSRTSRASLSATYVLSLTQRRWGDVGWVPWSLDRRHLVRVAGQLRPGKRLVLYGAGNVGSGLPITPVAHVIVVGNPQSALQGLGRDSIGAIASYGYGAENSARGGVTYNIDAGASIEFGGPGRSLIHAGISVINLTFGRVAAAVPRAPRFSEADGGPATSDGRVHYAPAFVLPPIPTVTFRVEF